MTTSTVIAHETEIVCLKVCRIENLILVATSSRDKLQKIFCFTLEESFKLLYSSNEHTAVITCIAFSENGQWLVTYSQDKVVTLHSMMDAEGRFLYQKKGQQPVKSTVHDISIRDSHAILACQDKKLRRFDLLTCSLIEDQEIQLPFTPCLVDFYKGIIIAGCIEKGLIIINENGTLETKFTHSEMISCAFFAKDGQNIITISLDGCTCIWQLMPNSAPSNIFQFDDKVLPAWARDDNEKEKIVKEQADQRQIVAKGRWAERVIHSSFEVFPNVENRPIEPKDENAEIESSLSVADNGPSDNSLFQPDRASHIADIIESDYDDFAGGGVVTPTPQNPDSSVSSPMMSFASTSSPIHPKIQTDPSVADSRLELFIELANEISTNIAAIPETESERLRKTCNTVAGIIMPFTNNNIWIKQILEEYSDKLVELVREKLFEHANKD